MHHFGGPDACNRQSLSAFVYSPAPHQPAPLVGVHCPQTSAVGKGGGIQKGPRRLPEEAQRLFRVRRLI